MLRLALLLCALCSLVPTGVAADLPANDAGKHQLIVVGAASWFRDTPDLARLRAATAFTEFKPDSPLFKARYESILGSDYPIVAYLRPDGGVIYFADRHNMPPQDKLFGAIRAAHLLAKNAETSKTLQNQPLSTVNTGELAASSDDDLFDSACPDGNCPLDQQPSRPLFPNLRPHRNPLDSDQPATFDRMVSGWFSNSIGSGMTLIFGVIAMGFVLFFFVLLIGAMCLVAKLWK